MNLEITNWKPFQIDKIFDVYTGGDLIMSEIDDGDIPIASNSAENNNIAAYTSPIKGRKLFDHTKSISIADRGKFWAFIQPKDFYIATRVKALVCKEYNMLNIYHLAFVVSILNQESFKFTYGRNCCANLPNINISLPIQQNCDNTPILDNQKRYSEEGYIPDWEWMENYIKSLHHKPLATRNKGTNVPQLNISSWKEFALGRLFKVELSKGDIKLDDIDRGTIPLVSSGESNNGIVGNIDEKGDGKAEIFKGNKITIDMFGNPFYQEDDFYAVSHGRVNILVPKFELNKSIGLFIASIIKKEQYKFSYGRAVYSTEASNMIIELPVQHNDDGTPCIDVNRTYSDDGYIPDWAWMETYIKLLPYGDRL